MPDKTVLTREKITLKAANYTPIGVIGKIRLKIKVDGYIFEDEFVVTNDISIPCIIGYTLLNKYKIQLNFGNNKVEIISTESLKEDVIGYHRIITKNHEPIMVQLYKLGEKKEEAASEIVKKYLKEGTIRPSESPWRSPVIVVPKKDGGNRLCIDYRRLNDITIKDAYPMPRVDEFIDALEGAGYFTKLDAESGYHQIDMTPKDIEKTAFACREGLFEFTKMPFGLVNGPATFQRTMNNILKKFLFKFVVVYMDDILIYSKTREDHKRHVRLVLERLKEGGLKLNQSKCEYGKRELKILGHVISKDGVRIDEDRIKSIEKLPVPNNKKKLQSMLGLYNYCARFIKDSYKIVGPLYKIIKLKGDVEKQFWKKVGDNEQYRRTIDNLKIAIKKATLLTIPNTRDRFILTTDASNDGCGAMLTQIIAGEERMIAHFSSLHSSAERNYSTTEQELLAVVKALQHFREYLLLGNFLLKTDHMALKYLFKSRNIKARLAR